MAPFNLADLKRRLMKRAVEPAPTPQAIEVHIHMDDLVTSLLDRSRQQPLEVRTNAPIPSP